MPQNPQPELSPEEARADTRVYRWSPEGQEQIFDHPEQVPEGWLDHPPAAAQASINKTGRGNSAATQQVPGVEDDSGNRGNPQGEPQGNKTQGGESGQSTDQPFVLKPIDDVDKNWIAQHLNTRKVPFNPKWSKQKLYDLLRDAVSPAR